MGCVGRGAPTGREGILISFTFPEGSWDMLGQSFVALEMEWDKVTWIRNKGAKSSVELKDQQQQETEGFTHAWHWWNTYLHLWKSATWRFVCRGLPIKPIVHKLFQKTEAREHLPIHSMRFVLPWYKNQTKMLQEKKKKKTWEFPGNPVVKTWHFRCHGLGFNPWSRN